MSLQAIIAKTILKLPGSWLVKMSGGKPVELGGRTLDPHFQFIAHSAASQPPMSSMTAADARAASAAGLAMFAGKPVSGVTSKDFTIPSRGAHMIPVRLYTPVKQSPTAPMMVFYHFGGGVVGDLDTCHLFCAMMSKAASCPVLSVDYRLAPEHPFPAGLEDCIDAYEWAIANAHEYGAPAGLASIGGDSMGGNFSAVIAQEMKRQGKTLPALQFLIYPATDITANYPSYTTYGETYPLSSDTMAWFMEHYMPADVDKTDLRVSPGLSPDLSGLPPAIICTAGFDPLVDDGADYTAKLRAAGVPVTYKCYDSLAHGFTAFISVSPAAKKACEEMADMLARSYSAA